MSRLTERDKDCCQTCRNMGWCNLDEVCSKYRLYEKLAHYEELEEAGRLIELPCKVGDTIYHIMGDLRGKPTIRKTAFSYFWLDYEIFLTKAEAEEKLEELKGGE